MFNIGDKIAYPMHGAGVIEGVEKKCILGEEHKYYVLKLAMGDVKIMLPTVSIETSGVRDIVSPQEADEVIEKFKEYVEDEDSNNWNKRYRDNVEKLKNGHLEDVAYVAKTLIMRDRKKSLSNAERKMLGNARSILISELVLSKGSTYEEIESILMDSIDRQGA